MSDLIAAPAGANAPACALLASADLIEPTGGGAALSGHQRPIGGDIRSEPFTAPDAAPPEGESDHNADAREGSVFPREGMSDNCRSWTSETVPGERGGAVVTGSSPGTSGPLAEPAADSLDDMAAGFAAASKLEATRRAYRSDLRNFGAWCKANGSCGLPASPRTVTRYVSHLAARDRDLLRVPPRWPVSQ